METRNICREEQRINDEILFIDIVKDVCRFKDICEYIAKDSDIIYDDNVKTAERTVTGGKHQFHYRWEKRGRWIYLDLASINSSGNLFAKHIAIPRKLALKGFARIQLAAKR